MFLRFRYTEAHVCKKGKNYDRNSIKYSISFLLSFSFSFVSINVLFHWYSSIAFVGKSLLHTVFSSCVQAINTNVQYILMVDIVVKHRKEVYFISTTLFDSLFSCRFCTFFLSFSIAHYFHEMKSILATKMKTISLVKNIQ